MGIDVRKFIDVNITHASRPSSTNVRDTVVLITSEGTAGVRFLANSKAEWDEHAKGSIFTSTNQYVDIFFANGGSKVLVIEASSGSIATTLDDIHILIVVVNQTLNDAKTLATTFDSTLQGPHRKILIARATNADISVDPLTNGINSLAVKYSETLGAEMCIAAYLSKIKIYGNNTVHDYAFTQETISSDIVNVIDNTLFDTLSSYNFNFNIPLGGATRNIGGNMTSGHSLVNEYMLIVLNQTVTEQLLSLLVTKIKGNKALSSIVTVLSQELNSYVQNGYLTTNKSWSYDDWTVVHNNIEYIIIEKNTQLNLGYHVQVLPWSSLNSQDIAQHKAPPIYIVIADAYSVRKLAIYGEAI